MPGAYRVLVVEDKFLVAFEIEDALARLGYEVVGPVGQLTKAMRVAGEATLDAAVLDIDLSGEDVYPVADILLRRNIPFFFATAYDTTDLPDRFRHLPVLSKPLHHAELGAQLAAFFPATEWREARTGR